MKARASDIVSTLEGYEDIIVVGPDGNSASPGKKLRVYSYGGCIGKVATDEGKCELVAKTNKLTVADKYPYPYAKYLRESFVDGHKKTINNDGIAELEKEYAKVLKNGITLEDYFVKSFCEATPEEKSEYITNSDYLKLACKVAYNKMRNDGDDPGERKIQTKIAKDQIKLLPGEGLLVTDIEYTMSLSKNRPLKKKDKTKYHGKSDFVVFDGERIGLVELKYENKSMEQGAENSLYEHMLDFYDVITYSSKEIITECVRRMKIMAANGVLDSAWEAVIKDFEEKAKSNAYKDMIWCGFVFANYQAKEVDSIKAVKSQLFTSPKEDNEGKYISSLNLKDKKYENIDVRYQCIKVPAQDDKETVMDRLSVEESLRARVSYFANI